MVKVATAPAYLIPANGSDVIYCKASCLILIFQSIVIVKIEKLQKIGSLLVVGIKYAGDPGYGYMINKLFPVYTTCTGIAY